MQRGRLNIRLKISPAEILTRKIIFSRIAIRLRLFCKVEIVTKFKLPLNRKIIFFVKKSQEKLSYNYKTMKNIFACTVLFVLDNSK